MNRSYKAMLVRIQGISGMHYSRPGSRPTRLVIYGIGAPLPPDAGVLPDAPFILNFEVDLFVPDYIGYGRSEGIFTPKNCIKTFSVLFGKFKKGVVAKNGYLNQNVYLQYDEIYFIGRSFGGMYITWLPKLNAAIKNLCLIFPILDYVMCGKIKGEETVSSFMNAMNQDGYHHLYRGINTPIWQKHFTNDDGLCPMEQVKHLSNSRVFIAHGKNDTNINFSHSDAYYKKLIRAFPKKKNQFIKMLYDGAHDAKTSNKAVVDYLRWMKVPEINSRE